MNTVVTAQPQHLWWRQWGPSVSWSDIRSANPLASASHQYALQTSRLWRCQNPSRHHHPRSLIEQRRLVRI